MQIALSIVCLAFAAKVQLRFYAFTGLVFLTVAEWRIGWLFLEAETAVWPITLLVCGLVLTTAMAWREIQHRRHTGEDMDDMVEHLHPRAQQNDARVQSNSEQNH